MNDFPSNATQAWKRILGRIMLKGEEYSPRDMNTREIIGSTSIIDMNYPIVNVISRKVDYNFMLTEAWWVLSGRNDVAALARYAPTIDRFSDDGITFAGAYGPRIINQFDYVVNCLANDIDSRQALMTIWTPNPEKSKDIPCTISLQFLLRDNVLHCVANMRSSDAWIGFIYDVFVFSAISAYIKGRLIERFELGSSKIKLGNLHLTAGSQHLYERTFMKAISTLDEGPEGVRQQEVIPFSALATVTKNGDYLIESLEELKDRKF